MQKMTFFRTLVVVGVVQGMISSPILAQDRNSPLGQVWPDANKAFLLFSWSRVEDNEEIYSSALYTEISQNTLNIYNTYKLEPFGKSARCGGLGCDLAKGQLVASLKFESNGNRFVVRESSGKAGFLTGAKCRVLEENYLLVLECRSNKTPDSINMPSIFRFAPGS